MTMPQRLMTTRLSDKVRSLPKKAAITSAWRAAEGMLDRAVASQNRYGSRSRGLSRCTRQIPDQGGQTMHLSRPARSTATTPQSTQGVVPAV